MKLSLGISTFVVGLMAVGFAYTQAANTGSNCSGTSCPGCESQPATNQSASIGGDAAVLYLNEATSAPATTQAAVDAGNTLCMSGNGEDAKTSVVTTYNNTIYHFCCKDCIAEFNKDPEKHVQDLAANPAKYGVTKK